MLMVFVRVCRGVVSIRTVGLSRVFSLCSRCWQPDCHHLRLPDPLPTEKCERQMHLSTGTAETGIAPAGEVSLRDSSKDQRLWILAGERSQ